MKPGVSLNGFEARTDHAHYFMLAGANQVLQRPSHVPLVIGDQHAHISRCRNFHANRADKLNGARGSRDIEGKAASSSEGVGQRPSFKAEKGVEKLRT